MSSKRRNTEEGSEDVRKKTRRTEEGSEGAGSEDVLQVGYIVTIKTMCHLRTYPFVSLECEDHVVYLGIHAPYKATIHVPLATMLTTHAVRNAAILEQCVPPPPQFPHGEFDVISSDGSHQVAIFRHRQVTACRTTNSYQHGKLPFPVENLNGIDNYNTAEHPCRISVYVRS